MRANKEHQTKNMGEEIYLNEFMQQYKELLDDPVLKERLKAFVESMSCGLDELISDLMAELRVVTTSDAASIYVVDGNVLRFIYVQNETLERDGNLTDEKGENRYLGRTVHINENSMCGYVAKTKQPLSIGDVRSVPPSMPFGFNDEYDKSTGYNTVSALTTPILDDTGEVVGILQLINHVDEEGEVAPYEDWMLGYVMLLTEHFLPMIAKSFDRYRDEAMGRENSERAVSSVSTQIREVYDALREGLVARKENKNLPWLKGNNVAWGKRERNKESNISKRLLAYSHYVNQFEDINTVIEMMLTEARDATRADGGTFYLVVGGDRLRFAYFQNDTLSSDNSRNHYMNVEMPISVTSISGYVALEKKILNIPDVEYLPEGAPYSFNRSFDESSGYCTVSMLTVPVLGAGGTVLAVLQLINSKDMLGNVKAFDEADMRYADLLAGQTMPYLTRSIMTRRLIDTMLRMSEMRDPLETGAHVQRVG
ncbi:GAF domain-containing protein [Synergistaceae bacterium OttesenSCG-928-I11]|nr:GAF domain-containing protein [Synergistaceae bacterium OttesenSCG-928-I11]